MVCPLLLDGARHGSRAARNAGGSRSQERTMRDGVVVIMDADSVVAVTELSLALIYPQSETSEPSSQNCVTSLS